MTVIQLSDEQAAVLRQKAAAAGLSLEDWLMNLAAEAAPAQAPVRHIADVICEATAELPDEVMAAMPADGASQHDHYIYGWPKREG